MSRCSFPPELLVQIKKCFVNKKHCLSPSFFKDNEPRRTLLSFPLSTEGTWIREPGNHKSEEHTAIKILSSESYSWCNKHQGLFPKIPRIIWYTIRVSKSPTLWAEETMPCVLRAKLIPTIFIRHFLFEYSCTSWKIRLKEGLTEFTEEALLPFASWWSVLN